MDTTLWRRPVAAFLALAAVLAAGLVAASTSSANAADRDAVTGISVTPASALVGDGLEARITWQAPAGTQPSDTFTVGIPSQVTGIAGTQQLRAPDGSVIANCVIEQTRATCTFTDYVATASNVQGELTVPLVGAQPTNGSGLDWTTGQGRIIHTDTEITPRQSGWADAAVKTSTLRDNGNILYDAAIRGSRLDDGTTVTDTYDPRTSIVASTFKVYQSDSSQNWTLTDSSTWTLSDDPANHRFTVTIPDAVTDGTIAYRYIYEAAVDDSVASGDVIVNTFGTQDSTSTDRIRYVRQGGGGTGDQGTLAWTKVDEDGEALAGATFTVTGPNNFSATVADDGAGDRDTRPGHFSLTGLAEGTYTVVEAQAPDGYVRSDRELTATLSAADPAGDAGELVNVKAATPTPTPTPTVPDDGGTPDPGTGTGLTRPGRDGAPLPDAGGPQLGLLAAGVLAIALGSTLALRRRRT
ncbi:SpaA isopeptide-forming pilin-related protein [Aeromicrobium sp. CnD17-E]|uniref:SpaA isopeptide-forming pilin-related protein n=1 Tax=Aeromicrobium sp. CnD17-E TaxID=2954487 RepID=UPI002096CC0D|nr:SpaA isopeptide-forming pilin-related protein [Aeromicrobium sp. CnD17-E]MCO7239074.1 SpaA isopeptide-forming pilin-related protein [Aeromicrobium sp. CnD17-E]